MLAVQVSYWDQQEKARHNLQAEAISQAELAENRRHNQEMEQLGWAQQQETIRHNKEQETIGFKNVDVGWGNVKLGYSNLEETANRNSIYAQSVQNEWLNSYVGKRTDAIEYGKEYYKPQLQMIQEFLDHPFKTIAKQSKLVSELNSINDWFIAQYEQDMPK